MHKRAIYSLLLIVGQSIFSNEQEPYPVHIAKGDNRKCFLLWSQNRTFPDHLNRSIKKPQNYSNAFKFYRWTLDDKKREEVVTKFKNPNQLSPEEKKQISDSLYRIQKVQENRFHIYLTALDDKVAKYFTDKINQKPKSESCNQNLSE